MCASGSLVTRIELARQARADLDDIETYLQREAGLLSTQRMLARISDKIDLLTDFPELGVEREDLGHRRVLLCRPYIIIYRLRPSGADTLLIVLRIVHGARDLPTVLSSG
jgi:plasmid stabilization system protein ParE